MKKKNWTLFVLLFCMILIFLFSNQNAKNSQTLSDKVAIQIFEVKMALTGQKKTQEEKENFVNNTRLLLRKSAHFAIYFLLGILCFLTLKNYNFSHPVLYAILICFLYACSDELHQLFVNERTAKWMDVIIDISGSYIGIAIINLLSRKKVS